MKGKVGYLVRDIDPDDDERSDYVFKAYLGRWEHHNEVKRIVYFEVENDD